jgi:hypothetical protein
MKFRFWFQPWRPPAAVAARLPPARLGAPNPPAAASHANLVRFYWQTESFAGEYDVPRGADSLGHDRGATTYSEAEGYVYTIASEWPAADSVYGCDPTRQKCVPDGTNGFELVYAGGHCHAPNCISLELTIKETGDPLVVAAQEGLGTVLCYTSDPAPHWGCNLVFWKKYADFWLRCLDLVISRR